MGKLDELRRATGSNVAESMGKGVARTPLTHGASAPVSADRWAGLERLAGAQRIRIDRITRDPSQPRQVFAEAELAELTESIRTRGILQPIRVRWDEGLGMYVVIAGERRFRAAGMAELADLPCVVDENATPGPDILLDQLAENLVRLDLEPIEQAKAFRRLMEANGWSARRLAEALAIDHDKVNRAVRLLELPESVQDAVATGKIAPTTAFELSKIEDADTQAQIAERATTQGMSRAEAVKEVRRSSSRSKAKGRGAQSKSKRTSVTFRTSNGHKFTIENRRGVDDDSVLAAAEELVAQIRAKRLGVADAA